MVIDFVFDKNITPWNIINLTVGDDTKTVPLDTVANNIRRLHIPNPSETLFFEKKNIWHDGIEEIIFSTDGIFYNVFHADRLPCSIYIPIENDINYKSIDVLNEATILTDLKSQKRWKTAVLLQCTIIIIFILFLSVLFSILLNKLWFLSSIIGCFSAFSIITFVRRKTRYLLRKINKNASTDTKK